MFIVASHRFYPPDQNPYGSILWHIVDWWREAGHDVQVVTGSSPASDVSDQRDVVRFRLLEERSAAARIVNSALFPLRCFLHVLFAPRAPDVVISGTMPQVTMGFAMSLAARLRGASFIYHCMDLHPEAGAISGDFANPAVYRILRSLDLRTMRRAARVVVLSEDMRKSVIERDFRLEGKVAILNNFALEETGRSAVVGCLGESKDAPGTRSGSDDSMRVIFTGNLGRFQGLDTLVRAHASLPADVPMDLVFMGQGREREALSDLARVLGDSRVSFLDAGSPAEAAELMRASDLGVVSLIPRVIRYAFPSKTANYLSEGLPLLVICESDCALVQNTIEGGYGFAAEPGDVESVREALIAAHRAFKSTSWPVVVDRARDAAARESREEYRGRWTEFVAQLRQ